MKKPSKKKIKKSKNMGIKKAIASPNKTTKPTKKKK